MVLTGQGQEEETSFLGKGGWSNPLCQEMAGQQGWGRRIGHLLLTTLLSSPGQKTASREGEGGEHHTGKKHNHPTPVKVSESQRG